MAKTYIESDDRFKEDMAKLKANNPGLSGSFLIRFAVAHAAKQKLSVLSIGADKITRVGIEQRKKELPKDAWCGIYGGTLENGVCAIDKYETIATGHVRKSPRVIAVSAFPIDREDFKRSVLGGYESVQHAEAAYKAKPLK